MILRKYKKDSGSSINDVPPLFRARVAANAECTMSIAKGDNLSSNGYSQHKDDALNDDVRIYTL